MTRSCPHDPASDTACRWWHWIFCSTMPNDSQGQGKCSSWAILDWHSNFSRLWTHPTGQFWSNHVAFFKVLQPVRVNRSCPRHKIPLAQWKHPQEDIFLLQWPIYLLPWTGCSWWGLHPAHQLLQILRYLLRRCHFLPVWFKEGLHRDVLVLWREGLVSLFWSPKNCVIVLPNVIIPHKCDGASAGVSSFYFLIT